MHPKFPSYSYTTVWEVSLNYCSIFLQITPSGSPDLLYPHPSQTVHDWTLTDTHVIGNLCKGIMWVFEYEVELI